LPPDGGATGVDELPGADAVGGDELVMAED
jgi:hypothetical protein